METTKIQWCDSTANFWSGCTKVSAGCKNCYAETRDRRHMIEKVDHFGKGAPRLKHVGAVKNAMAMNRKPWICDACGEAYAEKPEQCRANLSKPPSTPWICGCKTFHRRRIFSLSLGDWLDAEVSIDWLAEMLDTIRQCDQVIWILCTKRPENWNNRLHAAEEFCMENGMKETAVWSCEWRSGASICIPKNIILLTSAENQEVADERIPALLKIPAACRGLSLEPLLGPVEFSNVTKRSDAVSQLGKKSLDGIDWLIIGGESGNGARPCNVDWIRSLVAQGESAGVATFVKQLGANVVEVYTPSDSSELETVTKSLRDKKGGDISEFPKQLQVRQFPKGF